MNPSRARGISGVHEGLGRGGGGGGDGGRGGGGRGGGRGGKGWRFTHKTTKGTKEQLKAAKDADGGWATHRIAAKEHDDLAKLQTRIDKIYYPQKESRMLEPLERRKLDINRGGAANVSAVATATGTTSVPGNVSLVSQETDVSSIASVVTGMQKNVAALIKANNNMRAISRLARAVKDYQEPEGSVTSEDLFGSDFDDEAGVRIKPKKARKDSDNPALAR